MKRFIFAQLLVCAAILYGCESEEEIQILPPAVEEEEVEEDVEEEVQTSVKMEIDAVVADVDAHFDWMEGDSISVVFSGGQTYFAGFKISYDEDVSYDGASAVFRGTVPVGTYDEVFAVYPGVEDIGESVLIDRKDGLCDLMVSDRQTDIVADENLKMTLTFRPLLHTIEYRLTVADGYDAVDLGNSTFTIRMTAADGAGKVLFWDTALFDVTSCSLSSQSECEEIVTVVEGAGETSVLECSELVFPFDGADVFLEFDLCVDGEEHYTYSRSLNEGGMAPGGRTVVDLEISDDARVGGAEEVVTVEIKASDSEIRADSVDKLIFTVLRNGVDVTDESSVYVNGSLLEGNEFSTAEPGVYVFYALSGDHKSDDLIIEAFAVKEGKTIVFADGVTVGSGWYDVNKVGQGNINGDINMCWAASASNMIQWFQDRYVAMGGVLPSEAVSGADPDGIYELALMKMFHDEWDNSRGGHVEQAIPWYFEGVLQGGEYASPGSQAVPKTEGGYWKSIWESEISNSIYRGYEIVVVPDVIEYHNTYTACYNNYYIWGNGSGIIGTERLEIFSSLVVECFRHGLAAMAVNLSPNFISASHAVTLWGYEIDNATGLLTRMWITDSDDLISEPKPQLLNEYSVSIGGVQSSIKLTGDTRYGQIYIQSLHPFSGFGSGVD